MKSLFVLCILAAVACSALGIPEKNDALLIRPRRDLLDNIRQFIKSLIERLQDAGREASEAVTQFTTNIRNEAQRIREKIMNDIDSFRNKVTDAIETVYRKFSNTSNAVNDCVESHRDKAANLLNSTVSLAMVCIDERIEDISQLIEELRTIAATALDEGRAAVEDMKNCTKESTNILTTGSCLGSVAMGVEVKSVSILSQTALMIGRINLSFATLPASMEVCAGNRLLLTGVQTGKIVMDVGTCSVTAIFDNITG